MIVGRCARTSDETSGQGQQQQRFYLSLVRRHRRQHDLEAAAPGVDCFSAIQTAVARERLRLRRACAGDHPEAAQKHRTGRGLIGLVAEAHSTRGRKQAIGEEMTATGIRLLDYPQQQNRRVNVNEELLEEVRGGKKRKRSKIYGRRQLKKATAGIMNLLPALAQRIAARAPSGTFSREGVRTTAQRRNRWARGTL